MNILIMTDLEGICEIDRIEQIEYMGPFYKESCAALMRDTNAAVAACIDAGAEKVYVIDGHRGGGNFPPDTLDARAIPVTTDEMSDLVIKGDIDYFMEIGAHAMAGTQGGFLDHTQNSKKWFSYTANGVELGEVEKHALFLAAYGVKTVFVSGDEAVCREAQKFLKGIYTVPVKCAAVRNRAELYNAEKCRARFADEIQKALKNPLAISTLSYTLPVTLELTLYRTDMCEEILEKRPDPRLVRINARTLQKTLDKIEAYSDLNF